ncbi:MAG: 3-isopropylmalate dehydratase large subunit [Candidatus Methanomethylicaceae archaeon]
MSMTISEKILAKASGKKSVTPGEYIVGKIDLAMIHDLTGPLTLNVLKQIGEDKPFDSNKIVIIFDHQVPANSTITAELHKQLRIYAKKYNIKLHDVGRQGICHQILAEEYVKPGMLIVGADSHTCTLGALGAFATGIGSTDMAAAILTGELWFRVPESIKFELKGELKPGVSAKDVILYIIGMVGADGALYCATEFSGDGIEKMSIDSRLTICNMAVEMGAKTGIINPDEKTMKYCNYYGEVITSDKDAEYYKEFEIQLNEILPQVALPHSVDNVKPVSEVEGIEVDQVFIGSCTNGRLEDLEIVARILKGKKVKARTIIMPASREVLLNALKKGIIEDLVMAGCALGVPGCGPCVGGHHGIPSPGEVVVSTTNRNFKGRMGIADAYIYLASPITAAYAAVNGKITYPKVGE